jgi:N-acetyl-alpha-D-glucosaminyl L-malate synthase BshA
MRIGIACYPTFGGSGVVATELALALAARGHAVHILAYDRPSRLPDFVAGVTYHQVSAPSYPLFISPPYTLALATKMADVAEHAPLDLLHVHYALPHAISAILARQMREPARLAVVTTLHGTDITLVGQDQSYLPITRFAIEKSDAATAVSHYLRDVTISTFGTRREIDVVPNFVDGARYRPGGASEWALQFRRPGEALLAHVSNFRPVKRIGDVIEIFDRVRRQIPARLLLVGDGPDRALAERLCREKNICDLVSFLGNVPAIERLLPVCDVLLLTSDRESFGLSALEAMACGVPVVGTDAGGLPEVVASGVTGFLRPIGDVGAMSADVLTILASKQSREEFGRRARERALAEFPEERAVASYLAVYDRALAANAAG